MIASVRSMSPANVSSSSVLEVAYPALLIERSMDPGWLSNAYLLAEGPGGAAVFVDSGAPMEPLIEAAERLQVKPAHVLRTHADPDHIAAEAVLGLGVVTGPL